MATTASRQILRLARSGSLERAWSLLEESGLADANDDPRALTLKGRLTKDRAKRAEGGERARLFAKAASLYEQSSAVEQSSYPLINAASLALLAGQKDRSRDIAKRVLELLDSDPDEAETPYWRGATRSEALLLLGRQGEAEEALAEAMSLVPRAWEDHAATIGQFSLICPELGFDTDWLDTHRPPRAVRFSGIMSVEPESPEVQRQIADALDEENVGFGYGALAAGADIWIAEALLDRGAELHILLPCPRGAFREASVVAVDPAWGPRFDAILAKADSVDELETADHPTPSAVEIAEAVALGCARHHAGTLQTEALRLQVDGDGDAARDARMGDDLREVLITAPRTRDLSSVAMPEEGRPCAVLCAVDQAGDTIEIEGGKAAARDCCTLLAGPVAAWDALQNLDGNPAHVGLDFRIDPNGGDHASLCERAGAMVDIGEEGLVLASMAFAFALLAARPDIRVEIAGNIRAPIGTFPIYALY